MAFKLKLSRTKRLLFVIVSCTIYFFFEITIGLKTGSLALIVDAFHQLNDLISYIVALIATRLTMSSRERPGFTFALKRCEIVGAFFNASILLALALSIFLQSIERFINVPEVDDPFLIFIVGCVGLALNTLCIMMCHDAHGHSHGRSHGHGQSHDHAHSHASAVPALSGSHEHPCSHDHTHVLDHQYGYQHDHSPPDTLKHANSNEGIYYQSLEEEIRAVRIPSLFTQVARPISHMIHHDHTPAHSHAHLPGTARPRDPSHISRFSRWRQTLFGADEESAIPQTRPSLTRLGPDGAATPGGAKHRSLDPGSLKYVLPDSQRWYDADKLEVRQPQRNEVDIADNHRDTHSYPGMAAAVQPGGYAGHAHSHTHTRAHDHTKEDTSATQHGHGHGHGHGHNLGFAGVFIHLLGDALNNIGVIIAAVVMWQSTSPKRFYADPAVSVVIGLIIFGGSLPLTLSSARVLLEAAPKGLDLKQVEDDLTLIPGVASVHCLHVWQLTEIDLIASIDVRSEARDLVVWSLVEKQIRRHLATFGINHVTISPEFVPSRSASLVDGSKVEEEEKRQCAVLNSPKA
ncbi:cation efflux protein [Dioszegia hungarica]|uniref:Cation efflux protein n=1 Tax=Dioszegia hungarica TaxID=4972 RepID=A0AA38HCT2_9TREE|nr:cation efflux protein [Dioszegia hungarica]KAI9638045.1 cation efflux protein [Dioszegia hungarica]